MAPLPQSITVYRSMDMDAVDDARRVQQLLQNAGISAEIADDTVVGVVSGTYEVRVAEADLARAEQIVAMVPDNEADLDSAAGDPSAQLDSEAVLSLEGTTAEVEAMTVQGLLRANGVDAMVTGSPTLPFVAFDIRVPQNQVEEARRIIKEAQAAGPAAAEEAERAGERPDFPS